MLQFVRLLYIDPQVVKLLNCKIRDPRPILGPQKGFNVKHRSIFEKCLNICFTRTTLLPFVITMQTFSNSVDSELLKRTHEPRLGPHKGVESLKKNSI